MGAVHAEPGWGWTVPDGWAAAGGEVLNHVLRNCGTRAAAHTAVLLWTVVSSGSVREQESHATGAHNAPP